MNITLEYLNVAFLIFLALFFMFYFYRTRNYSYWMIRNIPYIKPTFPFGSVMDLVLGKTYMGIVYDKMYKEFSNERFFGIIDLHHPVLVLRDPDLIKKVLIEDFSHFGARSNLQIDQKEYILRHCINMQGQEWKEMRALLSPAFTSGKIKSLYQLMEKCSDSLKNYIFTLSDHESPVEVTNILARFTLDMITTSAFGIETDSINNPDCEFFETVRDMLKTTKSRFLRRTLSSFFPSFVRFFSLTLIPTEVTSLLTTAISENVKYREENKVRRSDFLDSLINARYMSLLEEKSNKDEQHQDAKNGLTIQQMTAQAFGFFIAGFTTSTSNMTFCLYELSRHQAVQERLLEDIQQALDRSGGKMSFQAIQEMTYLDQVIQETLRLYGSGPTLTRICTKRYKVPNSDFTLEKGIKVLIPIYSLHHDAEYFPNPYSFQPERFSPEMVREMHPCVYLPFGEGPRNCIARHFGLLQIKLGIATLISNFKVNLSLEQEVPIEIDKRSFVVTPAQPVFLRFKSRKTK